MPKIFVARQGARRANTHWYLTDEQRWIAAKRLAEKVSYLECDALDELNRHAFYCAGFQYYHTNCGEFAGVVLC